MSDKFDRNNRAAIEAALRSSDPENPIARALAERIEEFSQNLAAAAAEQGGFPEQMLLLKPDTAFDEVVIRLTVEAIAEELGRPIEIQWL
ncbi:MAG: hypothetical protein CMJ58_12495 [Planctomycetaceae bacterium]|nr:hypothetical protein [Planctomycetaceae bacterium]